MAKIAIIGAGSIRFANQLIVDILSFPAMQGTTITLMDIDKDRLDVVRRVAERIISSGNHKATLECTLDRREALTGADYVLVSVMVGGYTTRELDVAIPMKYGVDQCVADTIGPGGVFDGLRTAPVVAGVCRDMEEVCPKAYLLNNSNPMAILTWTAYKSSSIRTVGLCHSVQITSRQIADWLDIPREELIRRVAGINHQAWFLQIRHNGVDLYPKLREKINDSEVYETDIVRFEMLKHLDYFCTESSPHNSEYIPWVRKRKDLIEKYCPGTDRTLNDPPYLDYSKLKAKAAKLELMASGKAPVDFERSNEYGVYIINAIETGEPFHFNGNVENTGLITNLPNRCCVEVPCIADGNGITPTFVGKLPPQCAALNRTNINVQELAVQAALSGNRHKAFQAIAFDPLTSAVLSLDEIQAMVDEMFEAHKQWLPQFSS